MLTAWIDILVEKGIITQEEYENKVRVLLEEYVGLTRFDDLEKYFYNFRPRTLLLMAWGWQRKECKNYIVTN